MHEKPNVCLMYIGVQVTLKCILGNTSTDNDQVTRRT